MEQLISYLRMMFGPQMFLEDYNRYNNLPLYLTENYQLFSLQIGEERYLLVMSLLLCHSWAGLRQ